MTTNEMLSLLTAAYTGPGSTEEGSFAGDVLRACADGMAELWSTEIDGMERRAFVSTATGDWLTKVCADRGVTRHEGEDDTSLRTRTLAKLRSTPASGNADHYTAWCSQAEDILRVRVLPLHRGNGTVDIVAAGADGRAPTPEALAAAQAAVDAQRPVGADAQVVAVSETPLHITASLILMDDATPDTVSSHFSAVLADFCKEIALLTNTVSYAKVMRLLLDTPGVADVVSFTLDGKEDSMILSDTAAPIPGIITLTEVS